jgi:hypothetical protein
MCTTVQRYYAGILHICLLWHMLCIKNAHVIFDDTKACLKHRHEKAPDYTKADNNHATSYLLQSGDYSRWPVCNTNLAL